MPSEIKNWSEARDMNPERHGPESWAVSSTEPVSDRFEIDWGLCASQLDRLDPFQSLELLHELLQPTAAARAGGGSKLAPGLSCCQ